MSVISISAVGGGYNHGASPLAAPAQGSRSSTQLASGATVTTVRGPTGQVIAVTTAVIDEQYAAALQSSPVQPDTSTFYVTA